VRVITERHMNEQRLAYLSRYDPLTGLANKMRVEDVLADVLNSCRRYKTSGSFLLCAIDRLADLNTTFGYDVADQVLVELSKRLRKEVRAGDCIGRLSGNKFAVVLSNCGHDQMEIAARRFRQAANDAVVVTAAGPVSITLSVGGAVFPKASETAQSIVMSAHEALNQAREQGANSFVAYHRSSERETMRQANLRTAEQIVQALSNKTLSLALQPIVDAETGDIAFHEALLRLTSPTGSLTTASHLIEPAERFRLTPLVDRHVLELAVKQLAINPMLSVSINVSASTAKDMEWIVAFMDAAKSIPDFANRMIIEITETAVIDDMTATRGFINKIHEVGCKVAIDDFGAGYTSFRNLRALDVDIVKIDGSFMKNISESKDDQVFVKALVGIATALNIKTVAEWVETDADAAFLASIGIDYIQGFTFGEPVAASDKSMNAAATDDIVTAA
ncbi:MAG: bifunctional diguanylate cyclase/phosphodiesterase, partial [Pseudomonadota bacterium]